MNTKFCIQSSIMITYLVLINRGIQGSKKIENAKNEKTGKELTNLLAHVSPLLNF